ncbi:hypothetical protein [Actinoplanes sp. NPDC049316]|uniref:hypothetical protein n=1 Tax=Actinoplanes sp. NPDC049316 TaxID=3154727 RepID=UPI003419BA87
MSRPAFLGDARTGDHIHFKLPAMDEGRPTAVEHHGIVTTLERTSNGLHPVIAFVVHGAHGGRFRCRPDLHITIF